MKAKIIDGEVKIFDQVPKVWKTDSSIIVNFSNKSSEQLEDYGFYNYIKPEYNELYQKLGKIYFDEEDKVFTHHLEKKEIEQDLQSLKEDKIKQLKKNTHRKLSETDWYIIREYETHIPVPYEVKMFRMELRDKVEQYENRINSLQDKFQVLAFNVSLH